MSGNIESGLKSIVLIIEDEPRILRLIAVSLAGDNFEVVPTKTPSEGLAFFEAHRATTHLVITDRDLPEMKGEVVAQRIREISGSQIDPYILMLSAGSPDVKQMLAMGVTEFMPKPFSPAELSDHITLADAFFK